MSVDPRFAQFRSGVLEDFDPVIRRAYKLGCYAHSGQTRKSGEDYMTHPIAIMNYLRSMGMDQDCLVAALLHDCLEDTVLRVKDLEEMFNGKVAYIIYFLSKDDKIHFKNKDHRRLVYFDRLEAGFCFDYRVYCIKLVDRLHNLSTLEGLTLEKKKKTAKETFFVFLPLFRKYLNVVPEEYRHYCDKTIQLVEEIVEEIILMEE